MYCIISDSRKFMEKLCLYWRFIEYQGSRVLDSSYSNSIGVLSQGATIDPEPLKSGEPISDDDDWGEKAPLGHALHGACECRNVLNLVDTLSMTIELHVKRIGSSQSEIPESFVSINNVVRLGFNEHGLINLWISEFAKTSEKKLHLNVWTHLALVFEPSGLSLLIDGSPVMTRVEFDSNSISAPVFLRVGNQQTKTTEVRVWSSTRSAAEIRSTMHSPLSFGGAASKWRGFKIKSTSSPPEVSKSITIPFPAIERRLRPRQIKSPSPSEIIDLQTKSAHVSVVVPELRDYSIVPPDTSQTDDPIDPKLMPEIHPEPEIISAGARHVQPASRMLSFNVTIDAALEYFDDRLEQTLQAFRGSKPMDTNRLAFIQIACDFSSFLQAKFRIGPFFAPRPSDEILSRLQVACRYAAICAIMSGKHHVYPRMLNCLRIPLLDIDLETLIKTAIVAAWENGDHSTALCLLERFVSSFPNRMDEITHLRQQTEGIVGLSRGATRSHVPCPACDRTLKDPLGGVCECRAKLGVCYDSGTLVDRADCVKCCVCESEYSLSRSRGKLSGNVSYARSNTLPDTCKFCHCKGSLSYS